MGFNLWEQDTVSIVSVLGYSQINFHTPKVTGCWLNLFIYFWWTLLLILFIPEMHYKASTTICWQNLLISLVYFLENKLLETCLIPIFSQMFALT